MAGGRLSWPVDGVDWPNRQHSAFVAAGGLTWHVQRLGTGPRLLLLHGTGASTHSFRDLAPLLSAQFEVLAPDLPGHGFTGMPNSAGLSLPGMAQLVGALVREVDFSPDIVVGHSAGAAILIEMTLDRFVQPRVILSVNGALVPIRGAALFSPLAKLLFLNPLVPRLFAWRALSQDATRRVLDGTGSRIDRRGVELYQRLFRSPGHVSGTLGMMANWDLHTLQRRMRAFAAPLVLISTLNDKAIPPGDANVIARLAPSASVVHLTAGGHLIHEEHPREIAEIVLEAAREHGVLSGLKDSL